MRIRDLPNSSKPRERFLEHGPEALSDADLLALILRIGNRQENVIEMSNRLLKEYGLENLFDCTLTELQKIKGIGETKAIQLSAISELGKRYNKARYPITKITCAQDVFNIFHDKLKNEKQENFYILILDNKNKLIKNEFLTRGILDASILHPREVFRPAIKHSAAKIILIHNHPSGDPSPSKEDLDITQRLIDIGDQMDIKITDHVIIGRDKYWSWVERE